MNEYPKLEDKILELFQKIKKLGYRSFFEVLKKEAERSLFRLF